MTQLYSEEIFIQKNEFLPFFLIFTRAFQIYQMLKSLTRNVGSIETQKEAFSKASFCVSIVFKQVFIFSKIYRKQLVNLQTQLSINKCPN